MSIDALSTSKISAADMPLDRVASSKSLSEAAKVKEVSRQFEAILLRQVLGEARKSASFSEGEENSAVNSIYNDMVTDQLAESISRSGSFGLATSLQGQLIRQTVPKAAAAPAVAPNSKTY